MESFESWWQGIESPWRRCMELAWESYVAGSVPVGSVLTDGAGHTVVEGRNRAFDDMAASQGLAGSYVAHAEINVLAGLPPGEYPNHVLWSSLEPCFLCSAAVLHSHVGGVRFAAADPVMSGVDQLPAVNMWASSRWPERHGPDDGPLGYAAAIVHLVWNLERRLEDIVAEANQEQNPALVDLARRYAVDGKLALMTDVSIETVLQSLWPDLVSLASSTPVATIPRRFRSKAAERLEIVSAMLEASERWREIVGALEASGDLRTSRLALTQPPFDYSDQIATRILDMPLRKLTDSARTEMQAEVDELEAELGGRGTS